MLKRVSCTCNGPSLEVRVSTMQNSQTVVGVPSMSFLGRALASSCQGCGGALGRQRPKGPCGWFWGGGGGGSLGFAAVLSAIIEWVHGLFFFRRQGFSQTKLCMGSRPLLSGKWGGGGEAPKKSLFA